MSTPTTREALEHLAEHYGLTIAGAQALCRIPTHPAGMRDELAGRAMAAYIAANPDSPDDILASLAYATADAMLEARNENR